MFGYAGKKAGVDTQRPLIDDQESLLQVKIPGVIRRHAESGGNHAAGAGGDMRPQFVHGQGTAPLFLKQFVQRAAQIRRCVGQRAVEIEKHCLRHCAGLVPDS